MKNIILKRTVYLLSVLVFMSIAFPTRAMASFRFVTWGDSRDNPGILSQESTQVKSLSTQPSFTLFNGDLCGSWSTSCIQTWVTTNINGGNNNGIGNITFPVRGNHDSGSGTAWSTFFNQSATATRIGATNYSALTADMTYSFDYQNAHFVGIDLPGGDIPSISSAQLTWMDNDLKASEARGIPMAFLFWHGAAYYVDDHSSTAPAALITVLNNHPSVVAIYNGHEHVIAHTTLDASRLPGLTSHTIEQFVDGTAGAPHYNCKAGRSDWCNNYDAFVTTDVLSSTQFTVNIYQLGNNTPVWTKTYTKGSTQPTPTPAVTATPVATPTKTPTAVPTPTVKPTATPTGPTPTPVKTPTSSPTATISPQTVDVNSDRVINIIDIGIIIDNYAKNPIPNSRADINHDGIANIIDIGIVIDHYGQTY